jgi:hypothetical protein
MLGYGFGRNDCRSSVDYCSRARPMNPQLDGRVRNAPIFAANKRTPTHLRNDLWVALARLFPQSALSRCDHSC